MNKVVKVTLNSILCAADLLCTPVTLVIAAIATRETRMEKVLKETYDEVEFAKKLMGDVSCVTNEQYEELIEVLSNHFSRRVLGKAYFMYKIREYQANTLNSKYWKNYMETTKENAKEAVELFMF